MLVSVAQIVQGALDDIQTLGQVAGYDHAIGIGKRPQEALAMVPMKVEMRVAHDQELHLRFPFGVGVGAARRASVSRFHWT